MTVHKFSEAQSAVIASTAHSILVIAGPGSGKTSTVIGRIRRLISLGTKPSDMVVITFTNAAATEIVHRLSGETDIRFGYIGTLHGFCLRLLQEYGSPIGYGGRVTVLDDEQATELLLQTARSLKGKTSERALLDLRRRGPSLIGGSMTHDELAVQTYFSKLRQSSTLDFDMILFEARRLLETRPELPWSHLFVDEYQDSGDLDASIYRLLPCTHKFFVGDPDQAIYGFRGGNVQNILAASAEAEVHTLSENFRSSSVVCDAANRLIRHNRYRHPKHTMCMSTNRGLGAVWSCKTDEGEAAMIAQHVGNWIAEGSEPADEIAVLCRSNMIAGKIAQALMVAKIPVRQRPVETLPKDWSYARLTLDLLVSPHNDTVAGFWLERRMGKEAAEKIRRAARIAQNRVTNQPEVPPIPSSTIHTYPVDMARLGVSRESIERIQKKEAELVEPTLIGLAFAIARDIEQKHEEGHGVTVTTIHGAKGREWSTVILAGCEQQVIPGSRGEIEEERRVMFVGLTRAKKRIVISYAQARRQSWGRQAYEDHTPSDFILDLGGDAIQLHFG